MKDNWKKEFENLYNDICKVITTDGEEMTDGECVDALFDVLDKYENKSDNLIYYSKIWWQEGKLKIK